MLTIYIILANGVINITMVFVNTEISTCVKNDWSDQIEKLGNPLIQIIFYFLESVFYHAVKVYVLTFIGD